MYTDVPSGKEILSEHDIREYIEELYNKIINSGEHFDVICGVERGGLHISRPLSEMLNIPHKKIKIQFYKDSTSQGKVNFHSYNTQFHKKEKILLVDDIVDSGSTFKYFTDVYHVNRKNTKTAAIYWNPDGKHNFKPDYFIKVKKCEWITFPWEV